jgi:D-arabinose 1-dehydrogenase-like Zn-dependent alcohol dehydrogenase
VTAKGSRKIKAFLLHAAKDLRATDLPEPVTGLGEVVIAIRRAGICGSDMHDYSHGQIGSFVPKRPMVPGQEFAGEVVCRARRQRASASASASTASFTDSATSPSGASTS